MTKTKPTDADRAVGAAPDTPLEIRWDLRTRLKLIESGIIIHGEFYAGDLIKTFEISRPQASKDIAAYLTYCPDNITYDRSRKRYVPTAQFTPFFLQYNQDFFFELMRIFPNPFSPIVPLVRDLPPIEVLSPVMRNMNLPWIHLLVGAMREKGWLSFRYQSMKSPEPKIQKVAPHTFVYDGMRWHIRGYSKSRQKFVDFVLGRILSEPTTIDGPLIDARSDLEWQKLVNVAIAPHHGLSAAEQQAIALDYGMANGILNIPTRAALVKYLVKLLRVGSEFEALPPNVAQIELVNKQEIAPHLMT